MKGRKVHFASLMDLCHLKKSELEPQYQKFKGSVVLRCDTVKRWFWFVCSVHWTRIISISHDSRKGHGHCIKASRMFKTSFWCSIPFTQVKMEDASTLFKKSKVGMSRFLDTFYRSTNGPVWKTLSFFSKGIYTVILWQDKCGKGNSRKFFWKTDGKKFQIGNVSLYIVKKDYSYLCSVDDVKLAGKKQNIDPMWKVLSQEVDLGESTSLLHHVYLGCTQRECKISKDIVGQSQEFVWIQDVT